MVKPSKSQIITELESDVASKVGRKYAALQAHPQKFLGDFGINDLTHTNIQQAKKYLVRVYHTSARCDTFDELRVRSFVTY